MYARLFPTAGLRAITLLTTVAVSLVGQAVPSAAVTTTFTVCGAGCDAATIQAAVDMAGVGDRVMVSPGMYAEAVVLNKAVSIEGAGSGSDPATSTIISTSAGDAILVDPLAAATLDGISLSKIRVTGTSGSNSGIYIKLDDGVVSNLMISQVVATGSTNSGIRFNGADPISGSLSNATISNSIITANGGSGIIINSALHTVDGFHLDHTTITGNTNFGFIYNPLGTMTNTGTGFTFSNVTVSDNNTAALSGNHEMSFFGFFGTLAMTDVAVASTANSNKGSGISLVGQTVNTNAYVAADNMDFTRVTVSGVNFGKGGNSRGALSFKSYSDLSKVSMSGVDLTGATTDSKSAQLLLCQNGAAPLGMGDANLATALLGGDAAGSNCQGSASLLDLSQARLYSYPSLDAGGAFTTSPVLLDRCTGSDRATAQGQLRVQIVGDLQVPVVCLQAPATATAVGLTATFSVTGPSDFADATTTATLNKIAAGVATSLGTCSTVFGTCTIGVTSLARGTTMLRLDVADAAGTPAYQSVPVHVGNHTVFATPNAPAITSISAPASDRLSVVFTPPTDDGGDAVANYEYSTDGGANWVTRSPASTVSPLLITGLTPAVTYDVKVRAVNNAGSGTASAAVTAATAATQTITFVAPATQDVGDTFVPTASTTSGLPVTVVVDGTATQCQTQLDGGVHMLAAGTCTLTATQGGNEAYLPAEDVTVDITVVAGDGVPSTTVVVPAGSTEANVDDPAIGSPLIQFGAASLGTASVSVEPVAVTTPVVGTPFRLSGATVVDIHVEGATGPFTVCLAGEPPARLWHFDGNQWQDITGVVLDSEGNVILDGELPTVVGKVCGMTATLSPVAVAQVRTCTPAKIGTVRFRGNSSRLTTLAKWQLRYLAYSVRNSTCSVVEISGYSAKSATDGSAAAALLVSQARAQVVADYLDARLRLLGVTVTVRTFAYGRAKPVASNRTPAGRAKNRRAAVSVQDS